MKRTLVLAAVASPLLWCGPALAQAQKPVSRTEFVKNIDARFAAIDTNHDGKLSLDELAAEQQREMQKAKALLIQKLTAQFHALDTNHDGQLSLQEFLAVAPGVRANETPQDLLRRFDANHDGKISADEFRAPQVAQFNRIDTNHDGVISPAEAAAAAAAAGKK